MVKEEPKKKEVVEEHVPVKRDAIPKPPDTSPPSDDLEEPQIVQQLPLVKSEVSKLFTYHKKMKSN